MFKDLIEKNMEVYVDNMVVKSKTAKQHIEDRNEVFQTLNKFQMKLNPKKCVFDVTSGKLMGFMKTQRRIKVQSEKIEAINNMPSPISLKEV